MAYAAGGFEARDAFSPYVFRGGVAPDSLSRLDIATAYDYLNDPDIRWWADPDGIEATRRIHGSRRITTRPVIIMVSAYGQEEAAAQAADEGIKSFLVKPISPSSLFDAIFNSADVSAATRSIDAPIGEEKHDRRDARRSRPCAAHRRTDKRAVE